jgi:hypothetical protein
MRTPFLFLLFLIGAMVTKGQTVPSICTAPDSIIANYKDDADRLAIRKFFRNNMSYYDSINIPQAHSDTALDALLAVYNAIDLPARDTVINLLDLHTISSPDINTISIAADSNLSWMQQLRVGNIPTGNSAIDSILLTYHFSIVSYIPYFYIPSCHRVVIKSAINYNIRPITLLFETNPDVYQAIGWDAENDAWDNITDSIYQDYVGLIYSLGWDDCPAGCASMRYWKFKVYFDCSVEYMGSYGTPLPTGIQDHNLQYISVYPNPFNETISINGLPNSYDFSISNILGQVLLTGQAQNNTINKLAQLSSGIYMLTIRTDINARTFKLYKD